MQRFILLILLICISCMQVAEARRFGGGHSRGYTHSYSSGRYTQPRASYGASRSGMSSGTKRALTAGAVGAAAGYIAGNAMASNRGEQTVNGQPGKSESASRGGFGFIKFVLLAIILLVIYRLFVRRRMQRSSTNTPDTLPDGTNTAVFINQSMNVFMQVQQLNTPAQLEALKGYLTPNMFQSVYEDVGNNDEPAQFRQMQTRFEGCHKEGAYWIASVRFYGEVKEDNASLWVAFNEIWHFSKANGEYIWRVAGVEN